MKQLLLVYKKAWVLDQVAVKWAAWIDDCPSKKLYSIELILDWSPTRIPIVLLAPVALSLAIALWINSRD